MFNFNNNYKDKNIMELYNVRVELKTESIFHIEIEANSCADAEELVQANVWEDDYTDEIRASSEIIDEAYESEELCPVCLKYIDACVCDEEKK